jgi:hypothetical protein
MCPQRWTSFCSVSKFHPRARKPWFLVHHDSVFESSPAHQSHKMVHPDDSCLESLSCTLSPILSKSWPDRVMMGQFCYKPGNITLSYVFGHLRLSVSKPIRSGISCNVTISIIFCSDFLRFPAVIWLHSLVASSPKRTAQLEIGICFQDHRSEVIWPRCFLSPKDSWISNVPRSKHPLIFL